MNRTERLYAIVEELRRAGERPRTARALADEFEVSTRTIKRDIASLQEAGVPIWSESGPIGGYGMLNRSEVLPPIAFTTAEAVAIASALHAAGRRPFSAEGNAALSKIVGAMERSDRDEARKLGRRIWFQERSVDSDGTFRALGEAIRRCVVVRIDYTDADGAATRARPVESLALAQIENRWYLLAWCRLRCAGRWFRLDRIDGVTATREVFRPRDVRQVFGEPPPEAYTLSLSPEET